MSTINPVSLIKKIIDITKSKIHHLYDHISIQPFKLFKITIGKHIYRRAEIKRRYINNLLFFFNLH